MIIQTLQEKQLITPPKFLSDNTHYLVEMGSVAYGVAGESSDHDTYGFCIPPKHVVFPHLIGMLNGFDTDYERFEQWQKHHVIDPDDNQEYDFVVYNIVKFFKLCMDNNPNMVDALFVPNRNVLHCTHIGTLVREKKKIFLHKGAWHKFKGYAYQQLKKIKSKKHEGLKELKQFESDNNISQKTTYKQAMSGEFEFAGGDGVMYFGKDKLTDIVVIDYKMLYEMMMNKGKRSENVKIHGFDLKFAYHIYRLIGEIEQILREGDLTLDREDRREVMKAIRAGEWTQKRIEEYFEMKEKQLEELYNSSELQYSPPVDEIRNLLFECLEHHYGSLSKAIVREDEFKRAFREIARIVDENRESL